MRSPTKSSLASLLSVAVALGAFGAAAAAFAGEFGTGAEPSLVGDKPGDPVQPGMADPGMADPGMADPGMAGAPPAPAPGAPAGPAAPAPVPPVKADAPVPLTECVSELERFRGLLKNSKSENTDILASMDALMKDYKLVAPVGAPPDDPAKVAAWQEQFNKDAKDWRKQVEDALVAAYAASKANAKTKSNDRDDVCIHAAIALGQTGLGNKPDEIFVKMSAKIENQFKTEKLFEFPQALWDETYKTFGNLNSMAGLDWLKKNWLGYHNNKGDPEKVKAAYDAVILYKHLKNTERMALVGDTLKWATSVESAAAVNKSKGDKAEKEVWDKVKGSVIKFLQVMSNEPKNDKGAIMSSAKDFNEWFRDHDKPKDPAWQDKDKEKPAPPPPPAPAK